MEGILSGFNWSENPLAGQTQERGAGGAGRVSLALDRPDWLAAQYPTAAYHGAVDDAADGKVSGIITVLQDITLLAQGRREIETERDRLLKAQHVARLGSWE